MPNKKDYRLKLIAMVKSNPMLWDKRDKCFQLRELRAAKWRQIAQQLGVSVERCRRSWDNLRDQYRRDLKRQIKYTTGSKWYYFDSMDFIGDQVSLREGRNSYPTMGEHEHDNDNENENNFEMLDALSADENIHDTTDNESLGNANNVDRSIGGQRESFVKNESEISNEQADMLPMAFIKAELSNETEEMIASNVEAYDVGNNNVPPSASIRQAVKSTPVLINPSPSTSSMANRQQRIEISCETQQQAPGGAREDLPRISLISADEDYHFVMSILPSLRLIPAKRKLKLRMGFLQLLQHELQTLEDSTK